MTFGLKGIEIDRKADVELLTVDVSESRADQRDRAREIGNRIRTSNANLKRSLKKDRDPVKSRLRAAEVIENLGHFEGAERMLVFVFLKSIWHCGENTVLRWMGSAYISPNRRFEDCTHRQLSVLVTVLEESAKRMEQNRRVSNGN
jgi:hypothetical protein